MSRRRRNPPKPKRIADALIVVRPGPHVVEQAAQAVADAREIAEAKRTVERALRAAGLSKRQACVTVAGMAHADLVAEAARVQAAPEPAPEPAASAWWRRVVGRWRQ